MDFKSFGFSDPGKSRDHNEDCYLCSQNDNLFLVADGMGGQASGETASRLAVKAVEAFVVRSRREDIPWPVKPREDLTQEQNRLLAGIAFANRRIYRASKKNAGMRGMGTTLVGAIVEGDHMAVANVGDSRLYRIRNGDIEQLTEDHSYVREQEKRGMLTRQEAMNHPQKHILTRALGINEISRIDISRTDVSSGDLFLLCSDGLHNMLDDEEILGITQKIEDRSLYKIGLSLVLQANLAGGRDNITVVLISF
ncbi:MAG: Stp1/IreP family PP2C-type Ser/Thr phosphatase [Deltaproteobacteria bacterium]|nr:Stp1/IreP family PP2C-type Ser/Thr phosphatase [Deltaproteobacteria bacterium]